MLTKKPHLVKFNKSILVSLWIFQVTLVCSQLSIIKINCNVTVIYFEKIYKKDFSFLPHCTEKALYKGQMNEIKNCLVEFRVFQMPHFTLFEKWDKIQKANTQTVMKFLNFSYVGKKTDLFSLSFFFLYTCFYFISFFIYRKTTFINYLFIIKSPPIYMIISLPMILKYF